MHIQHDRYGVLVSTGLVGVLISCATWAVGPKKSLRLRRRQKILRRKEVGTSKYVDNISEHCARNSDASTFG